MGIIPHSYVSDFCFSVENGARRREPINALKTKKNATTAAMRTGR